MGTDCSPPDFSPFLCQIPRPWCPLSNPRHEEGTSHQRCPSSRGGVHGPRHSWEQSQRVKSAPGDLPRKVAAPPPEETANLSQASILESERESEVRLVARCPPAYLSSSAPTPVCPGAANSPPLAEGPRAGVRQSISEGQLGRPPGWAQEGQLRQACKSAGSCFCGVSGRQPHSASFCCLRVIEAGATLIFIIPPLSSV